MFWKIILGGSIVARQSATQCWGTATNNQTNQADWREYEYFTAELILKLLAYLCTFGDSEKLVMRTRIDVISKRFRHRKGISQMRQYDVALPCGWLAAQISNSFYPCNFPFFSQNNSDAEWPIFILWYCGTDVPENRGIDRMGSVAYPFMNWRRCGYTELCLANAWLVFNTLKMRRQLINRMFAYEDLHKLAVEIHFSSWYSTLSWNREDNWTLHIQNDDKWMCSERRKKKRPRCGGFKVSVWIQIHIRFNKWWNKWCSANMDPVATSPARVAKNALSISW